MLVKKVELRFDTKELSESEVETRMTQIEETFSESCEHEFRTILKSYAGENNHHNKIVFEFSERQGINLIDVIKMLESWNKEKVINIDYSCYLRNLKASLV